MRLKTGVNSADEIRDKIFFKNPLARPDEVLIYYAPVRPMRTSIFEKRQLEIKENYNVTR